MIESISQSQKKTACLNITKALLAVFEIGEPMHPMALMEGTSLLLHLILRLVL
jgi:hypothetical protein